MVNKSAKKQVVQGHHISYEPEVIVKIYKGEHWAITQLNRRTKTVSKGFLRCLEAFIERAESYAVEL